MSSDADNTELAERFANQDATAAAATEEVAAALSDPAPVESVEIDPAEAAGFSFGPTTHHMLAKIGALTDAIQELHDREHRDPIQWCGNDLCQTLEDWR